MPKTPITSLLILLLATLSHFSLASAQNQKDNGMVTVWIGTGGKDGIFQSQLNLETGRLTSPKLAYEINGSGFLAMHPNGNVLYSTAKQSNGAGIASFRINRDAKLPKLEMLKMIDSGDGGAACVGIDRTGTAVFSAQYGGGSTTSYLVDADGALNKRVDLVEHGEGSGVNPGRQAASHPHWVGTSPDNSMLLVPDLGKDCVVLYDLDASTGKISKRGEVQVPPGAGPRHMKFHTSGKYIYVLNELALTISVFQFDAKSKSFKDIQLIETLPNSLKDKHLNSAAEIRVHPSGKFVYSSNRGHDSISVFSVDESTGKLTFVEREHVRGAWPRNFNLDPSGKWLLAGGQRSNTLTVFEVDPETGGLTYHRQCVNVPAPICILFDR